MNSKASKIKTHDRRSLPVLLVALALVVAGFAALVPVAGAETLVPPPPPSFGELPEAPQEEAAPPAAAAAEAEAPPSSAPSTSPAPAAPQAADPGAARVVRSRLAGNSLVLSLRCSSGGTVAMRGGASHRFACHGGRAGATLSLGARRRVGLAGLHLLVVVRSAGSTVRVPLTIARSRPSTGSASASSASYWNGVGGACMSYGPGRGGYVYIETETFNGFGVAAPGETLYWQSYLFAYEGGAWHPYGAGWSSYTVSSEASGSSGPGYTVIGGGGFGYAVSQAFNIAPRTWTLTGVYVWTKRSGFHFAWVNNNGGGYGDVYSQGGYCYSS
jgi:hypothetical protein